MLTLRGQSWRHYHRGEHGEQAHLATGAGGKKQTLYVTYIARLPDWQRKYPLGEHLRMLTGVTSLRSVFSDSEATCSAEVHLLRGRKRACTSLQLFTAESVTGPRFSDWTPRFAGALESIDKYVTQ